MTQDRPEHFDVIIVGGGMVGSALACLLAGTSLRICVLDAGNCVGGSFQSLSDDVHAISPRVSALTRRSQQLLEEIGVWHTLSKFAQPYQRMHVWDALGTEHIAFEAADIPCPSLGVIIENSRVISALHQQLAKTDVDVRWGARLQSLQVRNDDHLLTINDDLQLSCSLLIGADGALSRVRQLGHFATREWDYEHQAIVCTVRTEASHQATAWQRFDETGPLAFLPLPHPLGKQDLCSIVWSLQTEVAHEVLAQDETRFAESLERAIEGRMGRILEVSERNSFPLRQRHAKQYVNGGIVLVGDAAHTIHPLAGQGVNLGFKDVAVLSRECQKALELKLPIAQPLFLARYQRERQADNLAMMAMMEGFKRLYGQSDPVVRLLRNVGMSWVNRQRTLKTMLARQAMGL